MVDASEAWSVGRWLTAARGALEIAAVQGRTAIVVGGTGLYFKSLTEGLAEIPRYRRRRARRPGATWKTWGNRYFASVSPPATPRRRPISPGDLQRLGRAWEVVRPPTGR